jgi:drug/metabolite transporter (DMT)-like permease
LTIVIPQVNNFIGELAALGAAFLWAATSVVYSRLGLNISPLQLNFFKGLIAIAFIALTLAWQQATLFNSSLSTIALLSISGIVGIGLGDTAYFAALNILGARRTLLLETLSPPIGAFLALIFISEQLTASSWCGILLTLLGIVWVISERNPASVNSREEKLFTQKGMIWAVLAAISQACGAVISRFALLQSEISPLESTLIRLIGGTLIVFLLLLVPTQKKTQPTWQLSWHSLGIIAIAAFGSTYLGIWLQQISLKFAPTGIAQTFLATSPLFILPIVALMGEKISIRAMLGVLIALGGIALMFIR